MVPGKILKHYGIITNPSPARGPPAQSITQLIIVRFLILKVTKIWGKCFGTAKVDLCRYEFF